MKKGFFFMFPFLIRFRPGSARHRASDLYLQEFFAAPAMPKQLHRLGTTVSWVGNARYINLAQLFPRRETIVT